MERLEDRTFLSGGIAGFGGAWRGNNNNTGGPTFHANVLELTDGSTGEARSAFYTTAQPIDSWTASFTYQATEPGGIAVADGVTFVLQNQGLNALGPTGGDLAYATITPSVAIKLDLYNNSGEGTDSTGIYINGAVPTQPSVDLTGTGITLGSGDPIDVSLTYVGNQLTETLTDNTTTPPATFSTSYTEDLASVLGSGTAYVGFTGSTGDGTSVQKISNFTFAVGTTTTLTSSANPSSFGQSVTFTATVTSPGGTPPAGDTVNFLDGTSIIGSGTLNGSGVATFGTSTLALGTHSITAVYVGDLTFLSSTSAPLSQVVNQAGTTTTLTSNLNPSQFSQTVTFTATVSSAIGTPTGTVDFLDGTAIIGNGTLNGSGMASFGTSSLALGTHSITAEYLGTETLASSTSAPLSQVVNQAGTATTLTSSLNPSQFNQMVTFTATVTSAIGTPSGTVNFLDGSTILGGSLLNGSGGATFSTSTLSVNTHSITAEYVGSSILAPSNSAPLSQVVNQAATMTTLTSNPNPSQFNQTVTFTAIVTSAGGTPIGTVNFLDGTTPIGSGMLNGSGIATFSTSTLAVSTHSITAVYAGSTNFATSTSAPVSQVVNQAGTTTSLISNLNPSQFGQTVIFTAIVASAGGTPSGAVYFFDGTTTIGVGSLNGSGVATFSTSALAVSTHSITALYTGTTNFATSTSAPLSQVVNPDSTTTTLTSSANPSSFGQWVTFTATVTSALGMPTGFVNFYDSATSIGSGLLSGSGVATFSTDALDVAGSPHSITAVYAGTTNFASSTSAPLSQVVSQAGTMTMVASSLNPSELDQEVTFTATVTSTIGTPTGTVNFLDGETDIGSGTLSGAGVATFTTSELSVGTHSITAEYLGNTTFGTSTSAELFQEVHQASTTTTVTSDLNPSELSDTVTFTATVTSAVGTPPEGETVVFRDGDTDIGSGTLSDSGMATFSTDALDVAGSPHSITAVYAGDAIFAASTSAPLSQVVMPDSTATTLTSDLNPSTFGQWVTFTATVTSAVGIPTGFVKFYDSATKIGSGTLSDSGEVTFSTNALDVANSPHSITAVYTGDETFATSTSEPLSQQIDQDSTTTTLTSNRNPSTFGQMVTFTATVTSSIGTPAGTVEFLDDTTLLGSGLLNGSGVVTFSSATLAVGTHSITAEYLGDTNFGASTSEPVSQVVKPFVVVLTGGLDPASDSGVSDSDGITNVTQPIFNGMSVARSIVKVYVQPTSGGAEQLLGVTVADAAGAWSLQSTVALADGSYTVIAQAVNSNGVTLAQTQLLPTSTTGPLIIDTVGPTVTNVVFARLSGSVYVTFQDNLSGLAQSTLVDGANYMLNKLVHGKPGQFLSSTITTIASASPTAPQQVKITFNGGKSIRGGQYLLTILSGGITDVAGNALDGEFYGSFPSGNGTPGGNFTAGLSAIHNTVFAPTPIPNGYASPQGPAKRPTKQTKPRNLLPVGTIHNGRLVINNFH